MSNAGNSVRHTVGLRMVALVPLLLTRYSLEEIVDRLLKTVL
jgi:hypothetical protein